MERIGEPSSQEGSSAFDPKHRHQLLTVSFSLSML